MSREAAQSLFGGAALRRGHGLAGEAVQHVVQEPLSAAIEGDGGVHIARARRQQVRDHRAFAAAQRHDLTVAQGAPQLRQHGVQVAGALLQVVALQIGGGTIGTLGIPVVGQGIVDAVLFHGQQVGLRPGADQVALDDSDPGHAVAVRALDDQQQPVRPARGIARLQVVADARAVVAGQLAGGRLGMGAGGEEDAGQAENEVDSLHVFAVPRGGASRVAAPATRRSRARWPRPVRAASLCLRRASCRPTNACGWTCRAAGRAVPRCAVHRAGWPTAAPDGRAPRRSARCLPAARTA